MPTINAQSLLDAYPCLQCLSEKDRTVLRAGIVYNLATGLGATVSLPSVPIFFMGNSEKNLKAIQSSILCELYAASGQIHCDPAEVLAENPCIMCLDSKSKELILLAALKIQSFTMLGIEPDDEDVLKTASILYGASDLDIETIITGMYCAIANVQLGTICSSYDAWIDSKWNCPCVNDSLKGLQTPLWQYVFFSKAVDGPVTDESGNIFTDDSGNEIVFVV